MKYILYISCILFFCSCAFKNYTDKEKLLQYINDPDNGLIKEQRSGVLDYKITYKPNDLILEQELKVNSNYKIDSLRPIYSDCLYFILSVSKDSADVLSRRGPNFEKLLRAFSFELSEKIVLIENETQAVFYLNDHVYPRMFGSLRSTSVLLCFKDIRLKNIKDFTISVNDFLNDSPYKLKFEFDPQDLKNIPLLKL